MNAVELIPAREPYRLSDQQPPEQVFPRETEIHLEPGQKLPDLPPIEFDLSEEEAEEIRKAIAESIRIELKLGKVGYGKE